MTRAEINAAVALAWSEYTARCNTPPEKFTDMEKIAFQGGVAAGIQIGIDYATRNALAAIVAGGKS